MIKLIVSDMDGTLLNDEKKIDPELFLLLPRLKERGIRFVVASGRQYPSLKRDFEGHLEDVVLIAENGALVMEGEKELYARHMPWEDVAHCLDIISEIEGAEPIVCAKNCTYTKSRELFDFLSSPRFRYEMKMAKNLYHVADSAIKVSVISHGGEAAEAYFSEIRGSLKEDLNLVISGPTCLDTGVMGVNKGTAVSALQKLWGIMPKDTLVFGDQYNDVEMFSQAAHSYAMANASAGVKKFARYEAKSNNESGVVKVIRQLTGL